MADINVNDLKNGYKVEINNQPFTVVALEFVKPGKGQAFTRAKLKNIISGKVMEKTFKSVEKLKLADVVESSMRLLYQQAEDAVFMNDETFEQINIPLSLIGERKDFLMEDTAYEIILYNDSVIDIIPPTFLNMKVVSTEPSVRGDTASGKVLKPAITETGAKIQIPIFVSEGEIIKIDTRSKEYVSRSQ